MNVKAMTNTILKPKVNALRQILISMGYGTAKT
ncbi:hypothetical protein I588_02070 [Enterococcus pallens ATCC BAA-351]|uniref:Uncharacterized protein n=1 Tax=Enterococcus pallens ATCC BAA-351 TaxID=1158607 RepID=R2QQ64_9ENTE|nr:hypothetical protein UAU_00026 [Enterococcus pallens ATCC BAA-351]EOU21223.1 hypothetical protein I588_02070 [Enterococcus pallens ATCC BAA-351]